MIELKIWGHPAFGTEPGWVLDMAVPFDRVDELLDRVHALGFEFCTEILGRYLYTHPDGRTASIAPADSAAGPSKEETT